MVIFVDIETIKNESLNITNIYINNYISGNDKAIYELDKIIDIFLVYYTNIKKSFFKSANISEFYLPSGNFSEKYNGYFSDDEFKDISSSLARICINDLLQKKLISVDNPQNIADLYSKYFLNIKRKVVQYIMSESDQITKR